MVAASSRFIPHDLRCELGPECSLPDSELACSLCLDEEDHATVLFPFTDNATGLEFCCSVFKALQDQLAHKAFLEL